MKRILALLLGLIVSAALLVSCGNTQTMGNKKGPGAEFSKNDNPNETGAKEQNDIPILTEEKNESSESDMVNTEAVENNKESEEVKESEVAEEPVALSDAEMVEMYAEIMNGMTEDESMYVEARGTEIAMIYVFDEEYDEAMLEIMQPLLEEEMASEDFYETYLAMKAELPEMTALTVEFVTSDNITVYSQKFDDNYETEEEVIIVEEEDTYSDSDEVDTDDAEMVQYIVDYINESGEIELPEGFDVDIYASGNVIKIDMIAIDEETTDLVEANASSIEELMKESFDIESLKEVVPSIGIDVTIMKENGDVILQSQIR